MITLSKSGNTITFTFDENSGYLQNGTIDVPINSLSLVMDESDMATFKKSASNDIFISARYEEFGMSKSDLETWYKNNMVGSTGGGGGGVTPQEVEEMIDEAVSGKADTSAVTEAISEATSGKVDTSTYNTYTAATNTALNGKQNTLIAGDSIKLVATYEGDEINTFYRGWADFEQYDFRPSGSFYVVVGFDCGGSTNGSARFEFEVDNERKEVTIHFDSSTESWTCDSSWEDPQICDNLWQYLNINYAGNGTFYVEPYVDVTANDDGCVRFTYDLIGGGTTTDALDTVFDNLGNKADKYYAVASAEYVSSSTTINFMNVDGDVISSINASDFIVDGMVEDVRIDTISGVSYLVIDFNTASGKQDIQIPLTDIFDPSNYYNKTEIDAALSGKADTSAVTEAISEATSGKVDTTTYTAYTASTDARLAEDEEVTAAALNDLNEAVSGKQDTLIAGDNITISGNVISAEGGGSSSFDEDYDVPIPYASNNIDLSDSSLDYVCYIKCGTYDNNLLNIWDNYLGDGCQVRLYSSGNTVYQLNDGSQTVLDEIVIERYEPVEGMIRITTSSTFTNSNYIITNGENATIYVKGYTIPSGTTEDAIKTVAVESISESIDSAKREYKEYLRYFSNLDLYQEGDLYLAFSNGNYGTDSKSVKITDENSELFVNSGLEIKPIVNSGNTTWNTIIKATEKYINIYNFPSFTYGYDKVRFYYNSDFTFDDTYFQIKYYIYDEINQMWSGGEDYFTYDSMNDTFVDNNVPNDFSITKTNEYIEVNYTGSSDFYFHHYTSFPIPIQNNSFTRVDMYGAQLLHLQEAYDSLQGGGGGGKAVSGGTNISITTGETADTINCTLPIFVHSDNLRGDIRIGADVDANSDYFRIGIGRKIHMSSTYGRGSVAIGVASTNSQDYNLCYGESNVGIGRLFEIGTSNNSSGVVNYCVAIGSGAKAKINNAVAIGSGAVASGTTKTNINNQLTIDTSNQVYIYNKDNTEMICLQDQLGGGSITIDPTLDSGSTNPVANSAITTAFDNVDSRLSEDEEVTAAALNNLNDKFGGLQLVKLTQQEYDALVSGGTVDSSTLYIIV